MTSITDYPFLLCYLWVSGIVQLIVVFHLWALYRRGTLSFRMLFQSRVSYLREIRDFLIKDIRSFLAEARIMKPLPTDEE